MTYDAVIFDLFGTLVHNLPVKDYQRLMRDLSDAVGAPCQDFARVWGEKLDDRMVGKFGGVEGNIACVCETLGFLPDPTRLTEAARIRVEFSRRNLATRKNVVETLRSLRSLGCRVGLITDCTDEIPLLWPETPFADLIEHPVFSCSVGVKKPDPRIYRLACEGLGVAPQKCLYIGDGCSDELTGAVREGMEAALILPADPDGYDHLRGDARKWTGAAISNLEDVVELLGRKQEER